nr:DUF3322 domain-containing protein [Desulforhopalus vacuolatus]
MRVQVQKLWDRGCLLAELAGGETIFPRRLPLKGPNSKELSDRFNEVRDWITHLKNIDSNYRITWRSINHRILGTNEIPAQVWIDSLQDALAVLGKRREARTFAGLIALTRKSHPELLPWLAKHPLTALKLADDWSCLLKIVTWLQSHPRPGIYLRQIDIPGIHSKFIEKHRGVLGALFDLTLPPEALDLTARGMGGFCSRYGFQEKPLQIRFRILDPKSALLSTKTDQDITVTQATFAELNVPVTRVFITENEINFLAFPRVPDAMVIFGAGYGFDNMATAHWLQEREIHYWGDIDTHGFAILNQLRKFFPRATSFLMDQETLHTHRTLWGFEPGQETADLPRLTSSENALYTALHQNLWARQVRLEQERIGFDSLLEALQKI